MKMTKQDIEKALEHQHKMVAFLNHRLQQRELQEAQYGINAPPEVTTEIFDLTERLQKHEEEITRLQTLAVEDQIPLAEVKYRVLLAEVWNTPQGKPSVAGAAQLELARLELGLSPVRARELEKEIRAALAKEVLSTVDVRYMTPGHPRYKSRKWEEQREDVIKKLACASHLDANTAYQAMLETLKSLSETIDGFQNVPLAVVLALANIEKEYISSKVWFDQKDRLNFENFIFELAIYIIKFFQEKARVASEQKRYGEALKLLLDLNETCAVIDEIDRAIEFLEESLNLTRLIGDKLMEIFICWNIGTKHEENGQPKKAYPFIQLCVQLEKERVEIGSSELLENVLQADQSFLLKTPSLNECEAKLEQLTQHLQPSS